LYATIAHIKSILKEERNLHLPEKEVRNLGKTNEKVNLSHLAVNINKLAVESFPIRFTTEKSIEYHLHCHYRELDKW
jgi:hypothetical protein